MLARLSSYLLLCAGALGWAAAADGTVSRGEYEQLKKDIDALRKTTRPATTVAAGRVDKALDNKYGPNAAVVTKTGKLRITGLVQVWYSSVRNDSSGLFDKVNDLKDTNEASDNDSFQVKRTDLRFDMDLTENITGTLWIDPAREATSFAAYPSNQGLFKRGLNTGVAAVQTGAGAAPRLLQDAYINYHGQVPHHDFQIGQFRPALGEEGIRLNGALDFVERSMIGQLTTNRDTGATVHGTWKEDRIQYWLGVFNGAGNYYLSSGQTQNRSDDNDSKDFNARLLVRPVWGHKTFGNLELSASTMFGKHGESGANDPVGDPVNGLNRTEAYAIRNYLHAMYAPAGPVKGLWLRGEFAYIKDRNTQSTVLDPLKVDPHAPAAGASFQTIGNPFDTVGWYASAGYKLSESSLCSKMPSLMKDFEFAVRYEEFGNVQIADPANAAHTNSYATKVMTGGVNYYIKGHNAKIQLNYNAVNEPSGGPLGFHEVKNNNFLMNFQVWF